MSPARHLRPVADEPHLETSRPRVVIVGAGFGGLRAARALRRAGVDLVVVDRVNHHLFQPLLYQVATALLPPGDIAPPIRRALPGGPGTRVLLGEVTDVDARSNRLRVATADGEDRTLTYDYLVVAAGSEPNYYGHDEWRTAAPPMKTLDQAIGLRSRLLRAFEAAAAATDPEARRAWLTFLIVGAGPTGVELAGQLAALARRTLAGQFADLDPGQLRIVVADAGAHVLPPFPQPLRQHTRRSLERLGVEFRLGRRAVAIDDTGADLASAEQSGDDDNERVEARTTIWAAGVTASPLARILAETTGASLDRGGRLLVNPDCSVGRQNDVFAIGDMVNLHDLPGIAEPAIQQGRYVAKVIRHRLRARRLPRPFRYVDLGTMATISAVDAVADFRGLHLRGLAGKFAWSAVHLAFLVGWDNRAGVLANWVWTACTGRREQRVILPVSRARRPPTGVSA